MSYKIALAQRVRREIGSWNLPDYIMVDVYLHLREDLASDPVRKLVRVDSPWEGMAYFHQIIDPQNRLRVFNFLFHVIYGQDEQTLYVVHGVCNIVTG